MKKHLLFILIILISQTIIAGGNRDQSQLNYTAKDIENSTWDEIVENANGQKVYWYMWGGSDSINLYVNKFIGSILKAQYNIELEMVPVTDASVFVNKVLGEKQAGNHTKGSVDLMWINGENFRTMKEAGLLYGPFDHKLPNIKFINESDESIKNDFGYPVEGYESPYGSAQMVMVYDEFKVPVPPKNIKTLISWIKNNPGKFTYPAPPDFTGSVFIRHLFYYAAGGYENLLGSFNEKVFNETSPKFVKLLNELEPYLWRNGETYPENHTHLQDLFSNGEVLFDMSYNPAEAANLVKQGRYPETTKTFVFDSGTIANTHFVAIPYNSPNKAASVVLANLLLDPASQYEKAKSEVWGDLTTLSVEKLSPQWREKFNSLERPNSVLSPEELSSHKIPELQAKWLQEIEKLWIKEVLQK